MKLLTLSAAFFLCSLGFLNAQITDTSGSVLLNTVVTGEEHLSTSGITVITDEEDDNPLVDSGGNIVGAKKTHKYKASINNNTSLWDLLLSILGVC